jgi:hypothetical protein
MAARTERHLRRLAEVAGIRPEELRDTIRAVVEEDGYVRRQRSETPRITCCREIRGEAHASVSYIFDPEGTDVVSPGYEPPPGYRGP